MIDALQNIWLAFIAGLTAPLLAVCVLPLYPGFLAYLASQLKDKGSQTKIVWMLGLIVTGGVIASMMLVGLIVTFFLQSSLTAATEIISPIAFSILGVVSLLLIFNVNIGNLFPKVQAPVTKSPYRSSFLFGFFFGGIVLPCNPASLLLLFSFSTTTTDVITNLLGFFVFGLGMGLPLLILSVLSAQGGQRVIDFLTTHTRKINLIAGIFMLVVSMYYLLCVFNLFGDELALCAPFKIIFSAWV